MNHETERATVEIIKRHFELDVTDSVDQLARIRELLIEKLDYLLDYDFARLLRILYWVDISELSAKKALAMQTGHRPSEVLADLIIKRQIEKAMSRMKFKSENPDTDSEIG